MGQGVEEGLARLLKLAGTVTPTIQLQTIGARTERRDVKWPGWGCAGWDTGGTEGLNKAH